jgi:hypothetical protein
LYYEIDAAMNWRAVMTWIDKDAGVDFAKCRRYGITIILVDARSVNATQVIAEIRAQGLTAALYFATWPQYPVDAGAFAAEVSRVSNILIPRTGPEAPPLMLDLEQKSKQWIHDCISTYRRYQPHRPTAFTTEPFQDDTVIPMHAIHRAGIHWYVQLYRGDMSPVDSSAAVLEVCRWGFPADMVHPFYDGARLPADHRDGAVFTLERLP